MTYTIMKGLALFYFYITVTLINLIKANIRIDFPIDLKNKFGETGLNMNIATFGDIPYGLTLYGKIYYDLDNKDSEMACNPLTTIKIDNVFDFEAQTFVMLDRGSCSFVTKARNAQRIGAKAVIIINNNDDDINEIYMIDDGTGKDIEIPAVLISKSDGDTIKEYLRKNVNLRPKFILDFELAKSDVTNFEIIWSSTNMEIYELLKELKPALLAFVPGTLNFFPIYYMQSHPEFIPKYKLEGKEPKEINSPDCFGNGHYCSFFDTESLNLGVYEGQSVLEEDLRQICIFKERKSPNITEFLDYTQEFHNSCLNITSPMFTSACAEKSLQNIGYDSEKIKSINKCITDSFESPKRTEWWKSENEILRKERKFLRRMHVVMNPSMIVNKRLIYVSYLNIFKGRRTVHNVLEAICSSYIDKLPEPCYSYHIYADMRKSTLEAQTDSSSSGLSGKMIVFIVITVIILNLMIIFACKIYMKRKMHSKMESEALDDRISSAVTTYMALRDKN